MKKYILLFLITCTTMPILASNVIPHPKHTKPGANSPAFSAIQVTGNINLIIQGTNSKNPKSTAIISHNSKRVTAKIRHHTLYLQTLNAALPSNKPSTVKVRIYRLNKLNVYGRSSVTANHIKSDGLYLLSDTVRNITLNGALLVNKIVSFASNKISIRWLNGKALSVKSSAGRIMLAGSVTELQVKLRNHAKLDAKYLRAQRILIQTKNFAVAKVLPIKSLRAFASGHSNIYFYKKPVHISRYTSDSGNVLQLGEIR